MVPVKLLEKVDFSLLDFSKRTFFNLFMLNFSLSKKFRTKKLENLDFIPIISKNKNTISHHKC